MEDLTIEDIFKKTPLEIAEDQYLYENNHTHRHRTKDEDLKIINYLKEKMK